MHMQVHSILHVSSSMLINDQLSFYSLQTFSTQNGGSWSSEGCWVVTSNATVTVCQCDHLTHFAVLMNLSDEDRVFVLLHSHFFVLKIKQLLNFFYSKTNATWMFFHQYNSNTFCFWLQTKQLHQWNKNCLAKE